MGKNKKITLKRAKKRLENLFDIFDHAPFKVGGGGVFGQRGFSVIGAKFMDQSIFNASIALVIS